MLLRTDWKANSTDSCPSNLGMSGLGSHVPSDDSLILDRSRMGKENHASFLKLKQVVMLHSSWRWLASQLNIPKIESLRAHVGRFLKRSVISKHSTGNLG